jgi:hypothetical protein
VAIHASAGRGDGQLWADTIIGLMCSRVLAGFLALVLFWTGTACHETEYVSQGLSSSTWSAALAGDVPRGSRGGEGSVAHHHLDDVPAQAHAEAAGDPGMALHATTAALPADAGSQVPDFVHPALTSPFAHPPQRPPALG